MENTNYCFVTRLTILLFAFSSSAYASEGNNGWSAKFENQKVFIENKGQFHIYNSNESIQYAYDNGSTKVYFTSKGLSFSFLERWKKDGKERERENLKSGKSHLEMEAEEHKMEFKTDVVNLFWENANPNVEIVPEEAASDYYSYTIKETGSEKNINYIRGYKKLIYKNLYPNIDIEYIFHSDGGIKYALIVHPGADISKVKMHCDDNAKLKANGDLHISTLFGDLIDKAPKTFYSDNKSQIISSRFVKTGSGISFELGTYDHSQTVIIDPWFQTPTLPNSNGVWECEKDGYGNVYIIGGDAPLQLLKYNSAGTLQWTYNTPWDTTSGDWLGTFATDLAGNSYVTNGSTAAIQKINTSGSMVYNANGGSMDEYWNIAFNCDQTKLIIGGTRLNAFPSLIGYGAIFDINTSNGSVSSVKYVGYTIPSAFFGNNPDEVRSITSSHNGRYYYLTFDTIGCIDQNFSLCSNS